jgi:hypothetical protein
MQNRDGRKSLLIVVAFAVTSLWSLTCVAQDEKPWQFPAALRPSLDDRVKEFMAYTGRRAMGSSRPAPWRLLSRGRLFAVHPGSQSMPDYATASGTHDCLHS